MLNKNELKIDCFDTLSGDSVMRITHLPTNISVGGQGPTRTGLEARLMKELEAKFLTSEQLGEFTIVGATTPPTPVITFSTKDAVEIGRLDFSGPELVFTGNASESAKVFLDFVAKQFAERLAQERTKGREELAAELIASLQGISPFTQGMFVVKGKTLNDLIKRLSQLGRTSLEYEAADAIERLTARVAELEAQLKTEIEISNQRGEKIEDLLADLSALQYQFDEQHAALRKDAERYHMHVKLWSAAHGVPEEDVIAELDAAIVKEGGK